MNGSWILLYRSLLNSEIWQNDDTPFTLREAWIWLLLKATWKDCIRRSGTKVVHLKRGEALGSVRTLSLEWHRSKDTVSRYLERFEQDGMITKRRTPLGWAINIENYSFYQGGVEGNKDSNKDTNKDSDKDTNKDTDKDSNKDKLNNINKSNKECKEKQQYLSSAFDKFWEVYPKHTDKKAAQRAFAKIAPDDALLSSMIAAVLRQKQSRQWQENGGQYIPYPATWLNGRRWEDEELAQPATSMANYSRKPTSSNYDQRPNDEPDLEAVPQWLQDYKERYSEDYERVMKG